MKTKVLALFSGGLDSRLVVKILKEQGLNINAVFFKLPFGSGCCNENCAFNFSQLQGVKLHIIDCTKGKLLMEYLDIIKKPKYGYGTSMNPCIDCHIFMLKKAKKLAQKIRAEIIATGEVLGERPMSQHKKALEIVEKESGLKGKLLRPLSAKLLAPTEAEKKSLIDRSKLLNIHGRSRKIQIGLAKKYRISYPHPAGGCLLCEKGLKKRIETLLKRNLNEQKDLINLINIGRHFLINDCWIILGRNEEENKILEKYKSNKNHILISPKIPGPSALIIGKEVKDKKIKEKVDKLIKAYSKGSTIEQRKNFNNWRI